MENRQDKNKDSFDEIHIPIIDFQKYLNGDMETKKEVSKQLFRAFTEIGFVYLLNPGLEEQKKQMMFRNSKKFFMLPFEKKMEIQIKSGEANRGYTPVGAEKLTQIDKDGGSKKDIEELNKATPDIKETFECGSDNSDQTHPNLWFSEEDMPNLKTDWMDLYWTLQDLNK